MEGAIVHSSNSPLPQTDKQRIDDLEKNVKTLFTWASSTKPKLEYFDLHIKNIEDELHKVAHQQSTFDSRINHIETTLLNNITRWINDFDKRMKNCEATLGKVNTIPQNISTFDSRIKSIDGLINNNIARSINSLESQIRSCENTVNSVNVKSSQYANTLSANVLKVNTLEQHLKNYEGALSKANTIPQNISTFDSRIKHIETTFLNTVDQNIRNLESRITECEEALSNVKSPVSQNGNSASDKTVINFNAWAKNPNSSLPPGFYYITEDIRIRAQQSFTKSASETKWISNMGVSGKLLFPNPNLFNFTTDIHELYKMDQSRLRAKGENKIRIVAPCVIEDNGYINYPGELEFLN